MHKVEYSASIVNDDNGSIEVKVYKGAKYMMTLPTMKMASEVVQHLHEEYNSGKGDARFEANEKSAGILYQLREQDKHELKERLDYTDAHIPSSMINPSMTIVHKIAIGGIALSLVGLIIIAAIY